MENKVTKLFNEEDHQNIEFNVIEKTNISQLIYVWMYAMQSVISVIVLLEHSVHC